MFSGAALPLSAVAFWAHFLLWPLESSVSSMFVVFSIKGGTDQGLEQEEDEEKMMI